jgi:hypothetical protein
MPVRMRYESQGMVEVTATCRCQRYPATAACVLCPVSCVLCAYRDEEDDLVDIELGDERAVQQRQS